MRKPTNPYLAAVIGGATGLVSGLLVVVLGLADASVETYVVPVLGMAAGFALGTILANRSRAR